MFDCTSAQIHVFVKLHIKSMYSCYYRGIIEYNKIQLNVLVSSLQKHPTVHYNVSEYMDEQLRKKHS